MKRHSASMLAVMAGAALPVMLALAGPLGLPPVPVPADNPKTPEKIALGSHLFNDKRFSSTGKVSCATCHDADKAFTDSPLKHVRGHPQADRHAQRADGRQRRLLHAPCSGTGARPTSRTSRSIRSSIRSRWACRTTSRS